MRIGRLTILGSVSVVFWAANAVSYSSYLVGAGPRLSEGLSEWSINILDI